MSELEDRIIASLSGAMLKIAEGPSDVLKKASAGESLDSEVMASLSASLRKMAAHASLTASLASVIAKTKK